VKESGGGLTGLRGIQIGSRFIDLRAATDVGGVGMAYQAVRQRSANGTCRSANVGRESKRNPLVE
jgi:hypothetical protein